MVFDIGPTNAASHSFGSIQSGTPGELLLGTIMCPQGSMNSFTGACGCNVVENDSDQDGICDDIDDCS